MNFAEHFWQRFNIFALLALLLLLMVTHAIMMHFGRPPEMIRWLENIIAAVVSALIMQLGGEKKAGGT